MPTVVKHEHVWGKISAYGPGMFCLECGQSQTYYLGWVRSKQLYEDILQDHLDNFLWSTVEIAKTR